MRWTLLVDAVGQSGWRNMAVDQALLDLAAAEGRSFLRIYRWEPHCLSFGRHEPALLRYDRAATERLSLDTVRRPTGGRAVWHANEVTYAVAAPAECFGSLADSYRRIHETIAQALITLGFPATLAAPPPRGSALDAGACFAAPVGGEVLLHDRKVVGSAQLREGTAWLQHGSILLDGTQRRVGEVTRGTPPQDGSIGLAAARGAPVSFGEVAEAVARSARAWAGDWDDAAACSAAIEAAAVRHFDRFRGAAWTWRR